MIDIRDSDAESYGEVGAYAYSQLPWQRIPISTTAVAKFWYTFGGLFLWVCSATSISLQVPRSHKVNCSLLAGSSLLLLIMSGVLSGGVSPTGGRYGSVFLHF